MSECDWISDVCSSDLGAKKFLDYIVPAIFPYESIQKMFRSEERRVGKECVSTLRQCMSIEPYKIAYVIDRPSTRSQTHTTTLPATPTCDSFTHAPINCVTSHHHGHGNTL